VNSKTSKKILQKLEDFFLLDLKMKYEIPKIFRENLKSLKYESTNQKLDNNS
jgi:hypothetical protein